MILDVKDWLLPCIFIIKAKDSMKVYLTYSNTPLVSVASILQEIKDKSYPISDLNLDLSQIEVTPLESINNRKDAMLRLEELIGIYKQNGYEILNRRRSLVYKLDIHIDGKKVYIYLKSRNGSRILVGLFKKYREAIKWLNESYPNQDRITKVIYCNTLIYRDYLKGITP